MEVSMYLESIYSSVSPIEASGSASKFIALPFTFFIASKMIVKFYVHHAARSLI